MWRDPSRRNQNFQVRYVLSDGWGEPVQINRRPQSKMAFSSYEKEQLRESIGFLTLAFALALSDGLFAVMDHPNILITTLPLAFAAVMTGFLLHELAHKWMAQQYGCWAEYRGNKNGLYFALAMSAFGFLLAAPGAVMVSGRITDRQNGIIAAVGPLTTACRAKTRRGTVSRSLLNPRGGGSRLLGNFFAGRDGPSGRRTAPRSRE